MGENALRQDIVVICGIKNSGKTTLIRRILPKLTEAGYKVATIKHDGHDFESDVPGTDSYYHQKAGAYATAVYSKNRFMVTKQVSGIRAEELMELFPEADIILIEGCKDSSYKKIEVVRSANGNRPASNKEGRFLIATDIEDYECDEMCASLDDIDGIVAQLLTEIGRKDEKRE